MRVSRVALALLLTISALTAGGCGHTGGAAVAAGFHSPDLSFMPPLEFQLTDASGASVTAANLRGKVTLLYFGYTHCPDLCPTTLAYLSQVLGLTGTDDQLTALTKRYRAAYRRDPAAADGSYAVYHSSAIYVFDRQGRARLLASDTEPGAALAEDLQALTR